MNFPFTPVYPNGSLAGNQGFVLRSRTAPAVATNPQWANCVWMKEGNPPTLHAYDAATGQWDDETPGSFVTRTALPSFSPVSGSVCDGFAVAHSDASAVVYVSLNGGPYIAAGTGIRYKGTDDYAVVLAFAIKAGELPSDIVVAEYPRPVWAC